jgi:spoIIIJ-associated protein
VSQSEDMLSDVPGDSRDTMVSTDPVSTETSPQAGEDPGTVTGVAVSAAEGNGVEGGGSAPAETGEAAEPDVAQGPDGANGASEEEAVVDIADLEQEGEIAADYIEGLLDIADLDGDIDMDVEGNRAVVSVVGATLDELVGRRGEVLEALQELTRLAVHRQTGIRARLMLDIGGYRARRRAELSELGQKAAGEVRQTGTPKPLAAMTPFERKIVHGAVAEAGLRSESEGEEPNRRVVVYPAE